MLQSSNNLKKLSYDISRVIIIIINNTLVKLFIMLSMIFILDLYSIINMKIIFNSLNNIWLSIEKQFTLSFPAYVYNQSVYK